MPANRLRVLLLVPEAQASGLRSTLAAAITAAGGDAIEVECLAEASENGLRRRLASAPIDIVHFVGGGKSNAAARYATLDLAGSAGSLRAVNANHFGKLISAHAQLAVLQIDDAAGFAATPFVAEILCAQGLPAAIVAERSDDLLGAACRLYAAIATGQPLGEAAASMRNDAQAVLDSQRVALQFKAGDAAVRLVGAVPAPTAEPGQQRPVRPAGEGAAHEQRQREIQVELARKRAAGEFDAFLCHNWADKPAVKQIARALKAHGILPWLDEWELPPGQPWQPLLEQQISKIRAAAVFVGAAGVGPWQQQELYGFLREFVARNAPVIPVLLSGVRETPKLPIFLQAMTWVNFGQSEPAPLPRLIWGITGQRPADY